MKDHGNFICSQLVTYGSHERLGPMLELLQHEPVDVFWTVFLEEWPYCDNTRDWSRELGDALECRSKQKPAYDYMSDQDKAAFDALPVKITVYRGCSQYGMLGESWTLDRDIALKFTRGHRGIRTEDPYLYDAEISKNAIYLYCGARNEKEVLVNTRKLKKIHGTGYERRQNLDDARQMKVMA